MDPIALSGVRWDEAGSFAEFMDSRKGRLGVNFACYVGHSNLRRWVMGEDAVERAATADEIAAMQAMLREALAAGAAGISSSAAPTHLDIDGRPVPSRMADRDELLALAEELGRWGSGSVAFLPSSSIGGLDDEDKDYLIALGKASGLPVIMQGLGGRNKVDAPTATWEASVEFLDRATDAGAPVYSMLITRPFDRELVIGPANLHYLSVPSWVHMLTLPHDERARPAARSRAPRRAAAWRSRTTTATRPRERPCRRRCGPTSTSTGSCWPSTKRSRDARSLRSPKSKGRRRRTSALDLAAGGGPGDHLPLEDRKPRMDGGRRRPRSSIPAW